MKTAFIYSPEYEKFNYGPSHPLKPIRFKLTHDLLEAYGLLALPDTRIVRALPCALDDLVKVHSILYIEAVERGAADLPEWELLAYGLGTPENPIFHEVYKWSRMAVGGSLQAAKLVESGEVEIAFNIAGGQHHASSSRASGFCYFNDVAVVIQYLLDKGYRVAYVDIDAHHGDGVQEIFYRTDRVLKISLHESGQYLFPGTGFEREMGMSEGKGYTVNIPLLPYSDDEIFWQAFHETVPALIECFKPDILVTQLGVDAFHSDPLTTLSVTTNGFCRVIEELKQLSPGKWIAVGGGGYDIFHVPRGWALAWAIMNEIRLPDHLPDTYYRRIQSMSARNGNRELRDAPLPIDAAIHYRNLEALRNTLAYINDHQRKILCGI